MVKFTQRFLPVVFFLGIMSFNLPLRAQTPSPRPTTNPITSQPDLKVAALEAQLELMREYNKRQLDSIYWTLGAVVTVAGFLVAYNWLTNSINYQRDRDALQRELEIFLDKKTTELQNIATKRYEELTEASKKAGELAAKQLEGEIELKLESIHEGMTRMWYELRKSEAEQWEAQKVYDNALMSHLDMIKYALELEDEDKVSNTLDAMLNVFKNGAKPAPRLVREITDKLDTLPSKYSIDNETLRELVKATRA
ncbi:MAG: hypothetical protein AB1589_28090 [Cyanobacteriota bacterium]